MGPGGTAAVAAATQLQIYNIGHDRCRVKSTYEGLNYENITYLTFLYTKNRQNGLKLRIWESDLLSNNLVAFGGSKRFEWRLQTVRMEAPNDSNGGSKR